jgi:C4-dicarboxylate-specific signal transduction histidine kinase
MLLAFFFILRTSYPWWRTDAGLMVYGVTANLMLLISLSVATLSLYLEELRVRHERDMAGVLKERNDQLFGQSKYSELGMMAAGIAHEINNPLAIIQAKTTYLLRKLRDKNPQLELVDGLEQILFTSERINRTIQGVRDFVHQDDNLPDETIPLKNLVDDVLAFTGQRMKNHGVNLRFYGLDGFSVRGHRIQLEQVILNLLNNSFDAIEFLPDKWIELSAHETPEAIQLYFKDSGGGIPPEVATKMMEPFFTTKKMGKGTGLGLALARGIIEKHGGSLVYLSSARHTTFLLELPKKFKDRRSGKVSFQPPLVH